MSTVATYSYTHSVTYVTDNILKSLKDIILLSGLDPEHFADRWESNTRAIKTWLGTGDLRKVILEIYNPATDKLVTRWDMRTAPHVALPFDTILRRAAVPSGPFR